MIKKQRDYIYRFTDEAKQDIKQYKIEHNFESIKKIFQLLRDIEINGELKGDGRPERLRRDFKGFYSRRINDIDRLVYRVVGHNIEIARCKWHYND
jgi:toxin YoeB